MAELIRLTTGVDGGPRRFYHLGYRVEPSDERPTLPYVMVQQQHGQWVKARVEQQWRYQGRWRLAVYYYVNIGMQNYRVYDADQCRPAVSAADPLTASTAFVTMSAPPGPDAVLDDPQHRRAGRGMP